MHQARHTVNICKNINNNVYILLINKDWIYKRIQLYLKTFSSDHHLFFDDLKIKFYFLSRLIRVVLLHDELFMSIRAPRIVRCQPAPIAEDPFGPREPGLLFRLMEVMTSRYNQTNGHQLDSLPTNGGCIPRPDPGLTLHAGNYTPRAIIMPETVIEPYEVSGTHLIVAYYSNTSDLRLRSHQVRQCDKTQCFSFIFNEASRGIAHAHRRLFQHLKMSPAQLFSATVCINLTSYI